MKVSIIIVNYRSEKMVRYCVNNIRSAKLQLPYEIFVVNNDQEGALQNVMDYLQDVKVIQVKQNIGMGAGNNVGIQESQGEYVLVINPDVVIFPGAIEELIALMDRSPDIMIVGPKLLNPDRSLQYSTYTFPRSVADFFIPLFRRTPLGETPLGSNVLNRYLMVGGDHEKHQPVDWVLGAAMLIRKEFVDRHGGFDERFFLYNEDMDLCMRVWKEGGEVWYHPKAVMIHYLERLSAEKVWYRGLVSKYAWIHILSWLKFFWKWRKEIFKRTQNSILKTQN